MKPKLNNISATTSPPGTEYFFGSFCFVVFLAVQSLNNSTHVCLEKINTVRNVIFLVVHLERLVHRANQHHLDLTMHNVSKDCGSKFHAEHDEQQEGELKSDLDAINFS